MFRPCFGPAPAAGRFAVIHAPGLGRIQRFSGFDRRDGRARRWLGLACLLLAILSLPGIVRADDLEVAHDLYRKKDFASAAQEYVAWLKANPRDPRRDEARFFHAESLRLAKQPDEAIAAYRAFLGTLKSAAESTPANEAEANRKKLATARLAELAASRNHPEADRRLNEFLTAWPDDSLAPRLRLIRFDRAMSGGKRDVARADADALATLPADNPLSSLGRLAAARYLRRFEPARADEAWKILTPLLQTKNDALATEARWESALILLESRRFAEAERAFAEFARAQPNGPRAALAEFHRALAALGQGDAAGAEKRLAALDDKSLPDELRADLAWKRATALVALGKPADAKPLFDRAASLIGDRSDAGDLLLEVAESHLAARDSAKARETLKRLQNETDPVRRAKALYLAGRVGVADRDGNLLDDCAGALAEPAEGEAATWHERLARILARSAETETDPTRANARLDRLAARFRTGDAALAIELARARRAIRGGVVDGLDQRLLALSTKFGASGDEDLRGELSRLRIELATRSADPAKALAAWRTLLADPKFADVKRAGDGLAEALARMPERTARDEAVVAALTWFRTDADRAEFSLALADRLIEAGQSGAGLARYRTLAEATAAPESVRLLAAIRLADTFGQPGGVDRAEFDRLAATIRATPPTDAAVRSEAALALLNGQDAPARLTGLRELLPTLADPNLRADANLRLARCLAGTGAADEALNALDAAVKEAPGWLPEERRLTERARLLTAAGKRDDAARVMTELARKFPKSRAALDGMLRSAEDALAGDNVEEALKVADSMLTDEASAETRVRGLMLRARALAAGTKPELSATLRDLLAARGSMKPSADADSAALLGLITDGELLAADLELGRGEAAAALAVFTAIARSAESVSEPRLRSAQLGIVRCRIERKEFAAARDALTAIENRIKDSPRESSLQAEVSLLRGLLAARQADFDEARKHLAQVVESATAEGNGIAAETVARARFELGETWFHQRKYREAVRAFQKVETLSPTGVWPALALLEAGKCYEQLGEFEPAKACYERLLERHGRSRAARSAADRLKALKATLGADSPADTGASPAKTGRSVPAERNDDEPLAPPPPPPG